MTEKAATALKGWLPTLITVGAILVAWGTWKGTVQAELTGIRMRLTATETIANNMPIAYMPRGETDARLRGIEDKQTIVIDMLKEHIKGDDR